MISLLLRIWATIMLVVWPIVMCCVGILTGFWTLVAWWLVAAIVSGLVFVAVGLLHMIWEDFGNEY